MGGRQNGIDQGWHEGYKMIPYKLPEEREILQYYSSLLDDSVGKKVIDQDCLKSSEEAIRFAEFFWKAVNESNNQDKINGENSEHIFEKIIITLMAYYRSSGYEDEWEEVADKN